MAAPKGHPRYGGRQKGTRNKNVPALMERANVLGINPFDILLKFAAGDYEGLGYDQNCISPDLRMSAASQAAKYLYPQLKAIDMKVESDVDRPLEDLSDEELDKL